MDLVHIPDNSLCGQIFRKNNGALLFVCIHCTVSEFDSMNEYSIHINTHYTVSAILQEVKSIKEEPFHDIPNENKSEEPTKIKSEFDQNKDDIPLLLKQETECTSLSIYNDNYLEPDETDSNDNCTEPDEADSNPIQLTNKRTRKKIQAKHSLKYTCDYCNYKMRLKADLLKHMQKKHLSLTKNKVNHNSTICNICGKSYSGPYFLQIHMRYHANIRPFPCNYCTDKCFSKRQLKLHTMRKHTMDRPHQCQICGKKFVLASSLKEHMKCHTDTKDVQCEVCLRFFRNKTKLKQHSVVHTGAKPFKCRYCDLVYGFNSSRRLHERQVHKM